MAAKADYLPFMSTNSMPRILQAVEALKAFDRERAVALLHEELRLASMTGDRWKSAARLAARIGEIDIALEAARRYARTPPANLERTLFYTGELAGYGREDEAAAELERLPPASRAHQTVQHFFGTMAAQRGAFAEAEAHFRRALDGPHPMPHSWLALSTIKRFLPNDPDIAEMERQRPRMTASGGDMAARFHYALGKALHDAGEYDRAFASYAAGAEIRRHASAYDPAAMTARVERTIAQMSRDALDRLVPSEERQPRTIVVNGLPRSGTTLVEQILTSHSQVADGGETTLFHAALLPTGDASLAGALAYQNRGDDDPWGRVARDYHRMTAARFRTDLLTVDKTLLQSMHMGLLLHALPNTPVVCCGATRRISRSPAIGPIFPPTCAGAGRWPIWGIISLWRIASMHIGPPSSGSHPDGVI